MPAVSAGGLVTMRITSSAKRLTLCSTPLQGIPEIHGSDLILAAMGSISRANIIGKGATFGTLVPLEILKGVDRIPPVNILADELEYRDRIAV